MAQATDIQDHGFRSILNTLHHLNPRQLEDLLQSAQEIRRSRASIAEIEARAERIQRCPSCGGLKRQKWGRTRTGIQRLRCTGCRRT